MPDSSESLQTESDASAALANDDVPTGNGQDHSAQKSFEEMRNSPRKKFEYKQRIAPIHGDILPEKDEYFNVECYDISQGGISFFLKRPPGCERFAILLGQKPMITMLIGRVVYSRPMEHNGERMLLVGCQFVDRV